jgi:hypothetical protein
MSDRSAAVRMICRFAGLAISIILAATGGVLAQQVSPQWLIDQIYYRPLVPEQTASPWDGGDGLRRADQRLVAVVSLERSDALDALIADFNGHPDRNWPRILGPVDPAATGDSGHALRERGVPVLVGPSPWGAVDRFAGIVTRADAWTHEPFAVETQCYLAQLVDDAGLLTEAQITYARDLSPAMERACIAHGLFYALGLRAPAHTLDLRYHGVDDPRFAAIALVYDPRLEAGMSRTEVEAALAN